MTSLWLLLPHPKSSQPPRATTAWAGATLGPTLSAPTAATTATAATARRGGLKVFDVFCSGVSLCIAPSPSLVRLHKQTYERPPLLSFGGTTRETSTTLHRFRSKGRGALGGATRPGLHRWGAFGHASGPNEGRGRRTASKPRLRRSGRG